MVDKSELLRVAAFVDLPDDQIAWFLSQAQETHIKAGDTYVRQGDPADWMFVILEGQFQWRGGIRGGKILVFGKTGDGPRELALSPKEEVTLPRGAVTQKRTLRVPHSRDSV